MVSTTSAVDWDVKHQLKQTNKVAFQAPNIALLTLYPKLSYLYCVDDETTSQGIIKVKQICYDKSHGVSKSKTP